MRTLYTLDSVKSTAYLYLSIQKNRLTPQTAKITIPIMSEYIEAFRNTWYENQNCSEIRFDGSKHAPIWEKVWKMFAEWVKIQNGYQILDKGLKKRIQVTTNASDKGKPPRLRMEPWLFIYSSNASKSAIYVKIVMCNEGIRIGVDFNIKEANSEKATDTYKTSFKECFSRLDENWELENNSFSIYQLIKYKPNADDETYKDEFIELLAKAIGQYEKVSEAFRSIKKNEPTNSDSAKWNDTETDLFFFTLDKIRKDTITRDINGKIHLCGVEYRGKQMFCHLSKGNVKRVCDCLKWIKPCIATAFSEHYEINSIKQHFGIGIGSTKCYKEVFQINGEDITIGTNADANTVISDAIDAFDYFKENKNQFKLIFKYPKNDAASKREYMEKVLGKENIHPYNGKLKKNEGTGVSNKTINNSMARHRIIFGAPGTGKSHKANLDANELLLSERKEDKDLSDEEKITKASHMERVTFHPEYSYYDFVGSYKPVMKNVQVEGKNATERKIEYDFVPGPFTRILVKALKDKEHPYLLLIEEINRARVAAVFGDIFQLLDRTKGGESEYSICLSEDLKEHLKEQGLPLNELKLPPNLYIWATMNSADQGVYPLDTAFKRRWSMEYLDIDSGKEDDDWNQIRTGINKLLIEKGHVNEDKLMGYYFLKAEEMADAHLEDSLKGKVLMYLFDDAAKPCRKDIFKEINKARIYSDLRAKLSLSEPNLGIFDGAIFWPEKNTTTGSDQDSAAPKAEEAEPVDNQQ